MIAGTVPQSPETEMLLIRQKTGYFREFLLTFPHNNLARNTCTVVVVVVVVHTVVSMIAIAMSKSEEF